MSKLLLS
jgi:hypothetical protein